MAAPFPITPLANVASFTFDNSTNSPSNGLLILIPVFKGSDIFIFKSSSSSSSSIGSSKPIKYVAINEPIIVTNNVINAYIILLGFPFSIY